MSFPRIIVLGAGGTGRSIMGSIPSESDAVFLDDNIPIGEINGRLCVGNLSKLADEPSASVIVGFGCTYMRQRKDIFEKLKKIMSMTTVIHSTAVVDSTAHIGRGTWLGPHVTVMPNAVVGDNVIVCANASIDHDCRIEDHVYISPGVHIAGAAVVCEGAFLGTGANIIPLINIGAWSVIGAGAVVIDSIPANETFVGVPARIISRRSS